MRKLRNWNRNIDQKTREKVTDIKGMQRRLNTRSIGIIRRTAKHWNVTRLKALIQENYTEIKDQLLLKTARQVPGENWPREAKLQIYPDKMIRL